MSVTIYNASASSAIIRTYISHDGGNTWVSLKNLDGTTNLSIAAISYTGGNSIDVYAGCADGTAVNAYSLQGITAATAHTAAGTATLHLPSPGIYIIRCGNMTKRIVVEK